MSTLMEQTSEKEIKQQQNIHTDEELEIDLMDLLRKVIGIRKKIYKAAGIVNGYFYSNRYFRYSLDSYHA